MERWERWKKRGRCRASSAKTLSKLPKPVYYCGFGRTSTAHPVLSQIASAATPITLTGLGILFLGQEGLRCGCFFLIYLWLVTRSLRAVVCCPPNKQTAWYLARTSRTNKEALETTSVMVSAIHLSFLLRDSRTIFDCVDSNPNGYMARALA